MKIEEFENIFGNVPFDELKKINKYIADNYIEKSKVREKIEEYESKLKQPGVQNINTAAYGYYLGKKEGWEELLQEGDK